MSDPTTPAPPPPAPILYDQWGRAYVPLNPMRALVNVPLTAGELVELWRLNIQAAAYSAAQSRPDEWAMHEQRGQEFLRRARDLNPLFVKLFEQPPHYGSEGSV